MNFNKFLFVRIVLFFWILGIFYISFSSSPNQTVSLYEPLSPRLFSLHFIAFYVLLFLFCFSLAVKNRGFLFHLGLSFLLSMGIALIKELGQLFIPLRFFSWDDLLVDGLSCLLAVITLIALRGIGKMVQYSMFDKRSTKNNV